MTAWSISRAVLDLTDRSLSDYNLCKSREMVSCQSLRYMFATEVSSAEVPRRTKVGLQIGWLTVGLSKIQEQQ